MGKENVCQVHTDSKRQMFSPEKEAVLFLDRLPTQRIYHFGKLDEKKSTLIYHACSHNLINYYFNEMKDKKFEYAKSPEVFFPNDCYIPPR